MAYIVRRNQLNNGSVLNDMDRIWDSMLKGRSTAPAVDIIEEDDRYIIEADLPGLGESEIEAKVEDRVLILQSAESETEKPAEERTYLVRERSRSSFRRSFVVPKDADVDGIEAAFKDGVLSLSIRKLPEAKPRSIEIKRAL